MGHHGARHGEHFCGPERAVTPLFGQSDQPEYVGVPDDHWGEQVAAFVRPAPD